LISKVKHLKSKQSAESRETAKFSLLKDPKECLAKITKDYEHTASEGFLGYMRFIPIRDPAVLLRLSESYKKFQ